jgi:hypothetical protein
MNRLNAALAVNYTFTGPDGSAVTVPALDIDNRTGAAEASGENLARLRLERRIVAALLAHLSRKGWDCVMAYDGEEEYTFSPSEGNLRKAAMEIVFNLDDCFLHFAPDGKKKPRHWVRVVLGNGIDCISDWSYTEGDADGFNAAMDAFDVEMWA